MPASMGGKRTRSVRRKKAERRMAQKDSTKRGRAKLGAKRSAAAKKVCIQTISAIGRKSEQMKRKKKLAKSSKTADLSDEPNVAQHALNQLMALRTSQPMPSLTTKAFMDSTDDFVADETTDLPSAIGEDSEMKSAVPKTTDCDNSSECKPKKASSACFDVSNSEAVFEPGTVVQMPYRLKERWWKTHMGGHKTHSILFEPKSQPFAASIAERQRRKKVKETEGEWIAMIRTERNAERAKKAQKEAVKEANQLKGMVYTPIRNMAKLKKMSKKQRQSVMKFSVAIKTGLPKTAMMRGTRVDHANDL